MNARTVKNVAYSADEVTHFPPAHTEDRYKSSPLTTIGPAFLVFDEDGKTERWTIGYEELLYVVSGALTLTVFTDDGSYVVTGAPGDVITIGQGSTLEYAGSAGTRIYVVFSPLNWQDLIETAPE